MNETKIEYLNSAKFSHKDSNGFELFFAKYDSRNLSKIDYNVTVIEAGKLEITNNQLYISDVYFSSTKSQFGLNIPNGTFALNFVCINHKQSKSSTIMYSFIEFADTTSKYFRAPNTSGADHFFPVDGGIAYYRSSHNEIKNVSNHFESSIIPKFVNLAHSEPNFIHYDQNDEDVILFQPGFGDGVYKSYYGADADMNVTLIMTDFSGNYPDSRGQSK